MCFSSLFCKFCVNNTRMKNFDNIKPLFKNKPRLSTVSDSLLYSFIVFCLFLTTIGRSIRPIGLRLLIAFFVSLPFLIGVYLVKQYKDAKNYYFKKDEKECEKHIASLCFLTDKQLNDYFKQLLQKADVDYSIMQNKILIKGKYLLHLHFTLDELEQTVVAKAFINTPKEYICAVLGNRFSQNCIDLESRLMGRILLIDAKAVYMLMKNNDFYPKSVFGDEKPQKNFIKIIKASFTKKRAKRFALTGCALLFMSLIVFYPVYYIVAGCLLVALAVLAFFFGKNPTEKETVNIFYK